MTVFALEKSPVTEYALDGIVFAQFHSADCRAMLAEQAFDALFQFHRSTLRCFHNPPRSKHRRFPYAERRDFGSKIYFTAACNFP